MNTYKKAAAAVGILPLVVGMASIANAGDAFVLGPVEQVNSGSITVLGQNYSLSRGIASVSDLRAGAFVLIEGAIGQAGSLKASSLKFAKAPYVPGASDVALSGVITRYDANSGVLTIGALRVYTLDAVVVDSDALTPGKQVDVVGRQAAPMGPLWASEIRSTQAIEGTGTSIDTAAIEGAGKAFSAQAIEGTGRVASSQAIEGTGRAVSTQAIEGTGRATSTQAIEGTGRATSTQAIEGTGRAVSTQAIEGTGRSASTQAIEGTGRELSVSAIEGTGQATI